LPHFDQTERQMATKWLFQPIAFGPTGGVLLWIDNLLQAKTIKTFRQKVIWYVFESNQEKIHIIGTYLPLYHYSRSAEGTLT
jgi:hypothetical protein